jgi:hypothetical protein
VEILDNQYHHFRPTMPYHSFRETYPICFSLSPSTPTITWNWSLDRSDPAREEIRKMVILDSATLEVTGSHRNSYPPAITSVFLVEPGYRNSVVSSY